MTDRSTVSDLVFRDFAPAPAKRSDAEREAEVRKELVKLRAARQAPRVVPAAARRSAKQRLQ